jgi:predicted aspartyl protease
MGRIITQVTVRNPLDSAKSIQMDCLVDTGASHTVLPMEWKERLGKFDNETSVEMKMANNSIVNGLVCGPVSIKVNGFRPVYNEILFLDMAKDDDGHFEPLLGYVVLEQCQAAVDMLGHRLIPVKYLDLK